MGMAGYFGKIALVFLFGVLVVVVSLMIVVVRVRVVQ
jgi:hypothetical protein